jgi:DNA-directed RNA polymerase specialized sigma24 family protein
MSPQFGQDSRSDAMDLMETETHRLRLKLRSKIVYHLGHNCPDVDDLVQESLARFFRPGRLQLGRDTEEYWAYLNLVCRNVILEYRRRMDHVESTQRSASRTGLSA